jgi:hypothetical protein
MASNHIRHGQHYTRLTVSATAYCRKCGKSTSHRVDGTRRGPCLECIARLEPGGIRPAPVATAPDPLWPMACYCAAYSFPHHHESGAIRRYY